MGTHSGSGRGRRWAGSILTLLAAGGAVATALALLAPFDWFFELFSHFQPQYLVAQALAAAGFLGLWRPGAALLVLVTAVPNVMAVAPYLPGLLRPAQADIPGDAITLVAANILYDRRDFALLDAYVAARDPDILLLSEFTPRAQAALAGLAARYPHGVQLPRTDAWGMAVYSRYPLAAREDLELDEGPGVNLRLVLSLPGGPLELWSLHLASPVSRERAALRDAQLRGLGRLLADRNPPAMPRLLAGDLNVTAFSPAFRQLLGDAGLRDARAPFGLQVTWPAWPVPAWIAIDHVLAGDGIHVHRLASGPDVGSDHFPVELSFSPGP